jgi:putative sigma-54 modulation protein
MIFKFTEKNTKVSDELKAYVEKKLSKLDRLFRDEGDASVKFYTERGRHGLEVQATFGGTVFRVQELTSDPFASVDSAVAAIERKVRKNKTKLSKRVHSGIQVREIDALPAYSYTSDDDADDAEAFVISRVKKFAIKPMSAEEAILQMNLLGHTFFAFRDEAAGDAFGIVYKRNDGTYGLIESDN